MSTDWESRAQSLSALADGELDDAAVGAVSAAWRDEPQARERWHAYQLIGDVLRSDDLASSAAHDAAFLAALRQRMVDEPVVLAPERAQAPAPAANATSAAAASPVRSLAERRRRRGWIASSAIAAGFVMVVVATLAVRLPASDSAPQLAQAAPLSAQPAAGVSTVSLNTHPDAAETAPAVLADAKLLRDARLDRYLAAHKQFSGTSVLGVPSGFLRDAASDAPSR